jgi:hypothetical protein
MGHLAYNRRVLTTVSTTGQGIALERKPITRGEVGAVLLGLIPAAVISLLIVRYAVNVPYWDNWDMYIGSWLRGDEWKSCWLLFNGHRFLLPCLIGHALARLSSMSALPWVFVKIPFFIAIYFMVYRIYRSTATDRRSYLMAIPFALLVFTMAYWPMWIDPRPIFSQMAMLAFLVGIWVLAASPRGWKSFGIAALMAYISSLSFFSGNITWIVLGVMLWLRGYRDRRYYALWVVMALTILVPYTYDYLQPLVLANSAPIYNLIDPSIFALAFLGSPLVPKLDPPLIGVSATIGAIGVTAVIGYSVRLQRKAQEIREQTYPWIMIALWVIVNSIFIALGRTGLSGLQGALTPRYVSFGAIFWIAIVVLMVMGVIGDAHTKKNRGFSRFKPGMIILSLLITTGHATTTLVNFQNVWSSFIQTRIVYDS